MSKTETQEAQEHGPQAQISSLTGAKVRVFLTEVAEGTSNYRSLHSLTQQVEHQYHGRFLIELVQNAHDAFEAPTEERPNRIEVWFEPADSEHGSLLVANDGLPFSESNFERLSQLGQSDKDPEKSIGNKGIGFRSVLEVSDSPEVYSRSQRGGLRFDGFCFAFRPGVVSSLAKPVEQLATSNVVPTWPTTGQPLVENWSVEMLRKFRARVQLRGLDWLRAEAAYLSPYLLPVPLAGLDTARLRDFEERGFSTVIRLPLKSAELRTTVLERLEELEASTLLFLDKATTLRVVGDTVERNFRRRSAPLPGDPDGIQVVIEADAAPPAVYAMWATKLHVATAPVEFRKAVAALPGRWPEIHDVEVSVALRQGATPEAGKFSIYLPTKVATGSAVHINAPFFGDMSRTSIDFSDAYNKQLRETAADLVLKVVRERLAGKGEAEAQSIVDCLAPFGAPELAARWMALLNEAAARASASLDTEPLTLAEDGWRPWDVTSLLPSLAKASLLTEQTLRRHAAFEVFHSCVDSRRAQVEHWARARFPSVGANPLPESMAETLASVAKELHAQGGDWNVFWREVSQLMPGGQGELAKHRVLLGTDGELHRAVDGERVFFVPRQGTQDDSDVSSESGATDVPSSLRSSVAFLSEQIQVYDTNRPTVQTPVRTYLAGSSLVAQFRVDTIFSEVLAETTPPLPQPLEGELESQCRDILTWALRLMSNVVNRGRGVESTLRLLRNIPVPCVGGWFPMREASFGPGWPGKAGDQLQAYLDGLKHSASAEAKSRMLLHPNSPAWNGAGLSAIGLLTAGGVFNGLRLLETKANAWKSTFNASSSDFQLPKDGPPVLAKETWLQWAEAAEREGRPPFTTYQTYQFGSLWTFPGMSEFGGLSDVAREAISALILESLPSWQSGLESLGLVKLGGLSNRLAVTSPLTFFLRATAWLAVREQKGLVWSRPGERWLVPADTLANRARHFVHLRALPATLARSMSQRPPLIDCLRALGLQVFDPHSSGPSLALLEALTEAVGNKDVADPNVLLGQIRDAWQRFRPGDARRSLARVAVRGRDRRLAIHTPTVAQPLFVPDSGAYVATLEAFDFPVAAMGTADARDLREWFGAVYGNRVQFTSALSLLPKVSAVPWTGAQSRPMGDSDLAWLVRPLLVLAAQGRGVHAPAFKSRVETLATARVDWVPQLEVAVVSGDRELAASEVSAMWEPERRTLIATEACRASPEDLSSALAQALDREDLELPLRFVLRSVSSIEDPPDIATFLAPLRTVTEEQVLEVLEHLKGDVGHAARMLAVLVRVLHADADTSSLENADSEDELVVALASHDLAGLDHAHVLRLAQNSEGLFEFGRSVSDGLHAQARLAQWNEVLSDLGQPRLANKQWGLQLEAWLEEAAWLVKRLAAHAIRGGCSLTFGEMQQQYVGLFSSVDLSLTHWDVSFADAMALVAEVARNWLSDDVLATAIAGATSVQELKAGLAVRGVAMEPDPDECGRKNHMLVQDTARELERLRLATWLRTRGAEQDPPTARADGYQSACTAALAGMGFAREWSERDVFALLKAVRHPSIPTFDAAMQSSDDVAGLRSALGISDDELVGVESRLTAIKADWLRRQNLVKVCGSDFDSSEDNLGNLWTLLNERMPEEGLDASSIDLTTPTLLAPIKGKKDRKQDVSPPNTRKTTRQPKAVEALVGLFGEMHVFRLLRKKYGEEAVPASAWVSENSRKVFPTNLTDDGKGCDFAFTHRGKQYRVEVKATTGEDETFTLGSSEIRLAMDIGTKARRKKEVFVLVHVKNALSATPESVVLPNPYDPKHAGTFTIEDADARVRYRVK